MSPPSVAAAAQTEQRRAAQSGPPPVAQSVDQLAALCRRLGRALRAGDPADWAAGLTVHQLRVLGFLSRVGAASVGEVAGGLHVAQPSATETLDRLVCKGLVQREGDPSDRRVVRNVVTPAGRTILDSVWEGRRTLLEAALSRASAHEQHKIVRGLGLLCDLLDSTRPEGP